jgi:hypothetical protein
MGFDQRGIQPNGFLIGSTGRILGMILQLHSPFAP